MGHLLLAKHVHQVVVDLFLLAADSGFDPCGFGGLFAQPVLGRLGRRLRRRRVFG